MAVLPSGQASKDAHSLPPSPMSPDAAAKRPPDRVLPWFLPVLTALAGALAGLAWRRWYAVHLV